MSKCLACGYDNPEHSRLTGEERAVIEAAEVLARHNVLYFSYGNAPYPVGSPERAACDSELTEFRALKSAVDALRASRQPKPRYRLIGIASVKDTHSGRVLRHDEWLALLNGGPMSET